VLLLNFRLDLGGVWVLRDPRSAGNHGKFSYLILFPFLLPVGVVVNYVVVTTSLLTLTRANFYFDKDGSSTILGILMNILVF
jgi:hypothetical protein